MIWCWFDAAQPGCKPPRTGLRGEDTTHEMTKWSSAFPAESVYVNTVFSTSPALLVARLKPTAQNHQQFLHNENDNIVAIMIPRTCQSIAKKSALQQEQGLAVCL